MRSALVLCLIAVLGGCAAEPTPDDGPLPAELDNYVLDAVPADVPHRTFIDFEGKVQIVGYSLEPQGIVKPGETVKLTLYWVPTTRLGPGWRLFTHLLDPRGKLLKDGNVDKVGALRGTDDQALPPSKWKPGKVYVDSQEFQIPGDTRHAHVAISVGIWKGNHRLDVISGSHDDERRALIANIPTGIVPPKPVLPVKRAE